MGEVINNEIVDRIFDTMKEKKITQSQLATILGISQGTVAGWKQRNCPPPINYISTIAEVLNVSIDYLITGSDNPITYKLSSTEQYLIRLFRTTSQENKDLIMHTAIGLADENYYEDTNHNELIKTLQPIRKEDLIKKLINEILQ